MRKRLALILWSWVLCVAATAQQPTLTVGTAAAVTGQTVTGFIEVSAGSDAGTNIPVAVIRGPKPGPSLALVAGAHGTEYASIIALEKLILVNIASFEQKVPHVNPVDGKSMNRFYPGNPNRTQTERASWAMTKQVVEKSDYSIDLHGGDLDESLRPYSYCAPTGNAQQDAVSRAMVLAFGLDTIILSADRPRDPNAARYLETNASLRGKPSLTAEAGHAGTVEPEDVTALINGCLNVMRYLKMLPGSAPPVQDPVLDRAHCQRHQRNHRRFLSPGQARLVRATRHENRLRHRPVRQDGVGSACAVERRGPICLRRALDEER